MYEIEKGVPVPPNTKSGRRYKYPWAQMEVGDSFFVPITSTSKRQLQSNIHASAYSWGLRQSPPRKFSTCQVNGGARIWRIE